MKIIISKINIKVLNMLAQTARHYYLALEKYLTIVTMQGTEIILILIHTWLGNLMAINPY